ncbi:MAG: peptidylprolyl isomerase [Treponema sp.]|jgi:FKBP-type peptidyl-prolyl cis-trans isomerase SlyD|nr:peptidylprolyl isomerase [Treponema sp.]
MNITKDRVVSISYTIRDDKDKFIDSTGEGDFFDYLHGHENIVPGLERALEGRKAGDRLTVPLSAVEAYGERDEKLVSQIALDRFEGAEPAEGMQFEAWTPGGYRIVTVTGVEGSSVTIDANHPLAGKNLCFDVTVAAVREAQPEELRHGHTHGAHSCGEGHGHGHCDGCGGCSG